MKCFSFFWRKLICKDSLYILNKNKERLACRDQLRLFCGFHHTAVTFFKTEFGIEWLCVTAYQNTPQVTE